jgi:hypothetical protein
VKKRNLVGDYTRIENDLPIVIAILSSICIMLNVRDSR